MGGDGWWTLDNGLATRWSDGVVGGHGWWMLDNRLEGVQEVVFLLEAARGFELSAHSCKLFLGGWRIHIVLM